MTDAYRQHLEPLLEAGLTANVSKQCGKAGMARHIANCKAKPATAGLALSGKMV